MSTISSPGTEVSLIFSLLIQIVSTFVLLALVVAVVKFLRNYLKK